MQDDFPFGLSREKLERLVEELTLADIAQRKALLAIQTYLYEGRRDPVKMADILRLIDRALGDAGLDPSERGVQRRERRRSRGKYNPRERA